MRIDSLEKWSEVSAKLSDQGYSLYMMQYDVDCPEGFHTWFMLHETPGFEVVTYAKVVHDAILRYRP